MTFPEAHKRWVGGPANSPMYVGSAQAVPEPETTADKIQRLEASEQYLMDQNIDRPESQVGLLQAILEELRRINNSPREGAVSSVLIEDNPTKDRIVRVTSKVYAGSPLPVEEAIESHARAHRLAEQHALDGWRETVEALRA